MTVMLAERAPQTAVAPRMGTTEKLDYCRALAASGLLPAQYRQQPANLLYAVEFADSLGLHPMVAITGVHVIEGKPSASSALISALVRRAGHKLRVRGDAVRAVAQIVRSDDQEFTFEVAFTIEDADRAGLMSKKIWKNYPASMLKARAISAVARDACEEALFGIHYTPEELGAEVDGDGNPIEAGFVRQAPAQDQWEQAAPAPVVVEQQTPPAEQPWDAAAEGDLGGGRDWINEATEAATADDVREIWREAKAAGAIADTLAAVGRIGVAKAAEEKQARETAQPTPEPEAAAAPEAEALPGAPDDRKALGLATADMLAAGAAVGVVATEVRQMFVARFGHGAQDGTVTELRTIEAELRLRAAAERAHLATVDADFQNVYGLPIGQASVQQLDTFRARIEAAGGAR